MEKVEKIRNSIKQTKERRKNQVCKVYQVKLQNLSSSDIQTLERMFLEAKWLYNYVSVLNVCVCVCDLSYYLEMIIS